MQRKTLKTFCFLTLGATLREQENKPKIKE